MKDVDRDPDESGDPHDPDLPLDEATADAVFEALRDRARNFERRVGITLFEASLGMAQVLRFAIHGLAATLHLSGLFDVPIPMIRSLLNDYGDRSIEALFRAVSPGLSDTRDLEADTKAIWSVYSFFIEDGKPFPFEQWECREISEFRALKIGMFFDLCEAAWRHVEDINASMREIAGVDEKDAVEFLARIGAADGDAKRPAEPDAR